MSTVFSSCESSTSAGNSNEKGLRYFNCSPVLTEKERFELSRRFPDLHP